MRTGHHWIILVQMSRECNRNLKLDIGPFVIECLSGRSNLQPDSPPLLVPGMSKDRRGTIHHSTRGGTQPQPVQSGQHAVD